MENNEAQSSDAPAGTDLPRLLLACPDGPLYDGLSPVLSQDYELVTITTGWEALKAIENSAFRLLVIDSGLLVISGWEILKHIFRDQLSEAPKLFLHQPDEKAQAQETLELKQCDALLEHPFEAGELLAAIWALGDSNAEKKWEEGLSPLQTKLLRVANNNIKKIFSDAGEGKPLDMGIIQETSKLIVEGANSDELGDVLSRLRDHHSYSFVHSLKVASLMTIFSVFVGMNKRDQELMARGGLLHDVGKAMTPVSLLNKPAKLDPEEWAEMQNHVPLSGRILRETPGIETEIVNIAERHHEKLDGSGYPLGLKGGQLDDPSLVAAIMDVYSALTDKRAYKAPFSAEKSLSIMREEMRGHHLEEGLFDKFEEMILSGAAGRHGE